MALVDDDGASYFVKSDSEFAASTLLNNSLEHETKSAVQEGKSQKSATDDGASDLPHALRRTDGSLLLLHVGSAREEHNMCSCVRTGTFREIKV